MKEFTLRDHEIDVALEQLTGENTIHMIRDHLKSRNLLTLDDNVLDLWELELTRKCVAAHRKRQSTKGGNVQKELIHLKEVNDDGTRKDYYKPYRELTAKELANCLTYWHKYRSYGDDQLMRYLGPGLKKFGRDRIQRLLPFELPLEEAAL